MLFHKKNDKNYVITRRHVLLAIGWGLALPPTSALGESQCVPNPAGGMRCYAAVHVQALAAIYDHQWQSQWCWAAAISMLFRHYGYNVSQARIVQETFGQLVDMPAGSGAVISRAINRAWQDDTGRQFTSHLVAAYDFDYGVATIDNIFIINSLAQERPLIIGTRSHAMLLTRIDYIAAGPVPYLFAAGVLDPWPGIGARGLAPDELLAVQYGGSLRYLAAVQIT